MAIDRIVMNQIIVLIIGTLIILPIDCSDFNQRGQTDKNFVPPSSISFSLLKEHHEVNLHKTQDADNEIDTNVLPIRELYYKTSSDWHPGQIQQPTGYMKDDFAYDKNTDVEKGDRDLRLGRRLGTDYLWMQFIMEGVSDRLDVGAIVNAIRKLPDFYMPKEEFIPDTEKQCINDVRAFQDQFDDKKFWTVKMVDSWGKMNDGFFFGNVHAVGMFEQCLGIEAHEVQGKTDGLPSTRYNDTLITGRYCTIRYISEAVSDGFTHDSRSGPALAASVDEAPFSYATCVPNSCSREVLETSLEEVYRSLNRTLGSVVCQDLEEATNFDAGDQAVLVIIGLLALLMVAATVADFTAMALGSDKLLSGIGSILLYFSFAKNMLEIFRYERPRYDGRSFQCLHMMRAITVTWIIICHQYEFGANFISNTVDAPKYQEPVFAQVVTNGWVSVDTFFFISGLLIGYKLTPELIKAGNDAAQIAKLFAITVLRRIIRMMPSILVLAGFSATVYGHLGRGPLAPDMMEYSRGVCQKHWWKDALFINNFISWGNSMKNPIEDCLDHTWYTAVDMQLLLGLPLILLPMTYNRKIGLAWLGAVTGLSVLIPLIIVIVNELPPAPLTILSLPLPPDLNTDTYDTFMRLMYFPPWCRAAPWLVGVWGGVLISDGAGLEKKIKKSIVALGYVLSVGLGLALTIGLYQYNLLEAEKDYTTVLSAFYVPFGRLTWGCCLLFVVYSCYSGNAYLPNIVLSYPGWQPLSRLSFAMYLVAPLVQRWWNSMNYVPVYYSYLNKLLESSGVFFISFILGLFLSVMVERPFRSLGDHFILPQRRPSRQVKAAAIKQAKEVQRLESFYKTI